MMDRSPYEAATVIPLPQPTSRRTIAIVAIAIFLALLSILPLKIGFEQFFESLDHVSVSWLVILMMAAPIAIFTRLAFSPQASLPRLEISRSRIRIVPGRIGRLFGEFPVDISWSAESKEILLCHSFWQGLGDGIRLVVCEADGMEREVRATSMDYLSAHNAKRLADGISEATGLPVRLLIRERNADGPIGEAPWNPLSSSAKIARGAALATGVMPLVGGAVVGVWWPAPAIITSIGLALWLSQMGLLFVLARRTRSAAKLRAVYALTTVFTFAAVYAFAVVMARFMTSGG